MDLELQGKVALVTAASQGIGLAISKRLAAEGATVIMVSRRGIVPAIEPESEPLPGQLVPYRVDLSDTVEVEKIIPRIIAAYGRLDIAVLNTPGPAIKPFLDTTMLDWSLAFDLLVRPMVQLSLAASRHMVSSRSGSIVFMTSTWVKQPAPGGCLSASMRSAISALSKQLALELAESGVRVNQVQPGATATDRMQNIVRMKSQKNGTSEADEIASIVSQIPLGRWGEPDEIADAVVFLTSPRAAFITGATLQIDGGATRTTI